ncbi:ribonuclease HI [Mycobacteroides abscessus]|uniref:ribonuclease HI n=1 Tax=Mycobacteroides abscessus TaxID=36809 RepID=UPI000C25D1BA|nr:ribonuclease HI [Mycobacteroides abscessus]
MNTPERVIVYTDGGASPNPGPGGWGVVIRYDGKTLELHGGHVDTTNNAMELTAAVKALEAVPSHLPVVVNADSQYVVNGITSWMTGWKRRDWHKSDGSPVVNADLWKRLSALTEGRIVQWVWVRAHNGDEGNERADALATLGRSELRT